MPLRRRHIIGLICLPVIGGGLSLVLLNRIYPSNAPLPATVSMTTPLRATTTPVPGSKAIELPVRLVIPKLTVDTTVYNVGMGPDGAMAVNDDQDTVAWYEPGPRPGQSGSAVIAGHYGTRDGKKSVFSYLSQLTAGDIIEVKDKAGLVISFVVRSSRLYDPKADATDIFNSSDGKAHLNLITCEGTWNASQQTYSNRLVVFTDKVID